MRMALPLAPVAATLLIVACGSAPGTGVSVVARAAFEGPVPPAQCGANDAVETGLQGQVSLADQTSGRSMSEYACNLERVGHFPGEGASWQLAWFDDCAYYTTGTLAQLPLHPSLAGHPKPGQQYPGVQVIDMADPTSPRRTANLTTPGMLDPWESLKVNEPRLLLGAVNSAGGNGGPELDLYSLADGCSQPELIYSGTPDGNTNQSHGGNFSPDGQFYYGSNLLGEVIYPMDIADPADPKIVGYYNQNTHDLSISADGNRGYWADTGGNGLTIVDTSEIQARINDPSMPVVGSVYWDDGGGAQMTRVLNIGGNPNWLLFVDESDAGAARLIDISDETKPVVVSKLKLEVHMPENANAVAPDTAPQPVFGYNGHYCTVDNPDDAQIVACGYFQSGLRVFDIRDPYKPREIAYYIPPASPGYHPGSNYQFEGQCGAADWASAHSRIVLEREEIWFTSQCGGLHVVRFKRPLAELLAQ